MGSVGRRRLEFLVSLSFPLISARSGLLGHGGILVGQVPRRASAPKFLSPEPPFTRGPLRLGSGQAPTLALPQRGPFDSALLGSGCAGECLSGPPAGERVFGVTMIMVEGCHFGWQGAGVSSFWRRGCRDCRVWRGGRAGGLRLRFAAIRMRRGITGFRPTWTLSGRLRVLAYGESAYFRERVGVGASQVC